MRPISILGVILAALGLTASTGLYIRKKSGLKGLIFWAVVWLSLGTISVFPSLVYSVAFLFSMVRGPNFIFAVSIMGLYLIAFLLYNAVKRLEGQIFHLAQSIALLKYELEETGQGAEDDRDNRSSQ